MTYVDASLPVRLVRTCRSRAKGRIASPNVGSLTVSCDVSLQVADTSRQSDAQQTGGLRISRSGNVELITPCLRAVVVEQSRCERESRAVAADVADDNVAYTELACDSAGIEHAARVRPVHSDLGHAPLAERGLESLSQCIGECVVGGIPGRGGERHHCDRKQWCRKVGRLGPPERRPGPGSNRDQPRLQLNIAGVAVVVI